MYIQKIYTHKLRNIPDWEIEVGEEKRNLIITGKNGSGKTTLLKEIKGLLSLLSKNFSQPVVRKGIADYKDRSEAISIPNGAIKATFISWSTFEESVRSGVFFSAYYSDTRIVTFNSSKGPSQLSIRTKQLIDFDYSSLFTQYVVNKNTDKAFAFVDGNDALVQRIDVKLNLINKIIRSIIENEDASIEFLRTGYAVVIKESGKEPYDLSQLSMGINAALGILFDLILKVDALDVDTENVQGIVLIDELEAHLHVSLQKKILPFLTKMFPKVQFIVTTHSPFVITSDPNATVCDLEKRIVVQDLSAYSYEAIVEGYYGADQYSEVLKEKVARYEALNENSERNIDEETELFRLKKYFQSVPRNFFSKELGLKLREIEGYGR